MNQEVSPALRAAVANAFLFRCRGIPDLALGYLKESLTITAAILGLAPPPQPPRGAGDRFIAWLDAARAAEMDSAEHRRLRRMCAATPIDPPPLRDRAGFEPVSGEANLRLAAVDAYNAALEAMNQSDFPAAEAGYFYALSLDPNMRRAHLNLSFIYLKRKDWDAATEHFEIVLAHQPSDRDALIGMHNVAMLGDRMDRLIPHLGALIAAEEPPRTGDTDGPPVTTLSKDSIAFAADLIRSRGASHLRRATRAAACAALAARADLWFEAHAPALSWALLETAPEFRDPLVLLEPETVAVLEAIFGRRPDLSIPDTYLRRVVPREETTYIPFHQDVTALAKTGINVWVPLIACGVDAPGLEIMASRTTSIFPTVTSAGDYNQTEITEASVYEAFPPEVRFYPRPEIGDAVLFLSSTVHRSHIAPGMNRSRMSVELRFY